MKEIYLQGEKSRGKVALVDNEDFALISLFSWSLGSNGYPMAYAGGGRKNQKMLLMHHLILPPKDSFITDHCNENKLDNQRKNLCYVTKSFNNRKKNNTSGVSRRGWKWRAYIDFCGVRRYLGSFDTEEEARNIRATAFKQLEMSKLI